MGFKKIKNISDIKSLEDLNQLKLKKKYEMELKRLELQSSVIQMQMRMDPESIKETLIDEGKNYLQTLAIKWLPSFVWKFLNK